MNPILVDVLRGAAVESTHRGAIAVVDADGAVLASLGDMRGLSELGLQNWWGIEVGRLCATGTLRRTLHAAKPA